MLELFQVPLMMLHYAVALHRSHAADEDRELGASALEWAVISAIVVTAAVVIGTVIFNIVNTKATSITNCGNTANNTAVVATGC